MFKQVFFVVCMMFIAVCPAYAGQFSKKVDHVTTDITTNQPSAYEKKMDAEARFSKNMLGIMLYKPTYVLPVYYTSSPYYAIYQNNTPDNQRVQNTEFKAQLSLLIPVMQHFLGYQHTSLDIAYTQLSYWQVYASSQYFRETDYEPEVFLNWHPKVNWFVHFGLVHQSNGRGGTYERSWNRAYTDLILARGNWYFSVKPWVLIFKGQSSDLHNPNIRRYLGNGRFLAAYKFGDNELSIMSRNNLQSGFKRGAIEASYSRHIYSHFNLFIQYFSGYGQSLIEYDHRTNGVGIGVALNDWI